MSKNAKNKPLAKEFLQFATSKQFQIKAITSPGSGIDPTRTSTRTSEEYRTFAPHLQAALLAHTDALAWPTGPRSPELLHILANTLAAILKNQRDPERALEQLQAEWITLLG